MSNPFAPLNNDYFKKICADRYTIKPDAPQFLMDKFVGGKLAPFMTKNGFLEIF